ncbi:hypothetical protein C8J56DRAFT_312362 [Mycena floridula]|nr:hypothetical protein C8J56DRAFT_312362 [Mycena floridula]
MNEQTPLLLNPSEPSCTISFSTRRVIDARLDDLATISALCPPGTLPSLPQETALALIVLHELIKLKNNVKHKNVIYEAWKEDRDRKEDVSTLKTNIKLVWQQFLSEYRTSAQIQDVLWTPFQVDESSNKTIRVVDMLDLSSPLLLDPVIGLCMHQAWNQGSSSRTSRYDAFCTPRAMYAIELFTQIVHLVLLLLYVLYPPSWITISSELVSVREVLLLILSASILLRPRHRLPAALVLLSFLFAIPSLVFPGDLTFSMLLLSCLLIIIRLHSPYYTSPLYLISPSRSLPFALVLMNGASKFNGLVTFFAPVFFTACFLLSFSLENTFLQITTFAAPMETRIVFFLFFFLVIIAIPFASFILVTCSGADSDSTEPWDRYSQTVGLAARQAFFTTVVSYTASYAFPAPFNLLHLPIAMWQKLTGVKQVGAERVLWRTSVGPAAVLVAGILRFAP